MATGTPGNQTASPPSGYHKLGRFERCRYFCFREWTDGQGNYWCCGNYHCGNYQQQQPRKVEADLGAGGDDSKVSLAPGAANHLIVTLLRRMVANQQQIIDLLKDISIGLA